MRPEDGSGGGVSRPLLEVDHLSVHYQLRGSFLSRLTGRDTGAVRAVEDVTFAVRRGEVLGLVGESGSGKTTLGRAVLQLVAPTAGEVRLDGERINGLPERDVRALRRRMQMVFQDPHASLNPAMTILEAVGHPLRIHGIARDDDEVEKRVAETLALVGLTPVERFLTKYPSDLSGGQKQRAVLARAIITRPDLVVADEPVSMLDMSVRAKVLQLMLDLREELGLTYLYVTHDLATARFFCDRIAIMYLGRIVEIGTAEEIYADPKHPYTQALLRAIPQPDPSRHAPRDLPRGEVADAAAPPLGCAFHPRCPKAFAPCGWETRDLRTLLESHWAEAGPEVYERERAVVGSLAALGTPATSVVVPGSDPAAVEQVLHDVRAAHPDDPLWSGVEHVQAAGGGVEVRFHDPVDPVLQRVGDGGAEVACHLYRPDLRGEDLRG